MVVVLVAGGAGYVGSHACKALARAGHTPVCLDNLRTGWRDLAQFGPFENCDLMDADALESVFGKYNPDAVMHFAAMSLVGESVARPDLYHRVNITASLNLLDAMRAHDVRPIVFSSTCAIYGEAGDGDLTEDQPMAPESPYGASKLAVERILSDYETAFGMRAAALRYFNVAGADPEAEIGERHDPETHLIPITIEVALGQREYLSVYGKDYATPDGTCVRDYVHVMDLIDAHILALEKLMAGESGLRVNLGAGKGYSVAEVAEAVARVSGKPVPTVDAPRRAGDPPRLVADHSRATKLLGWRPVRSDLDVIIEDALRWHSSARFAAAD